jgi:VanZ family protein
MNVKSEGMLSVTLNRLKYWLPAVAMMTIIFIASAQPKAVVPIYGEWDLLIKKSAHLVGYALLALAYLLGLAGRQRPTARQMGLAFLLAVIYAATDEYHQSFVAGRGAGWTDVVIDGVGASVGLAAVWLWFNRRTASAKGVALPASPGDSSPG